MAWIGPLFHLAMIPAGIFAYMFYGLMPSVMVSIGILSAMLLTLKITKQKIETVYWVEFGFIVGFGIPAIYLNSPLLIKLQESISGLICGIGFAAWSYFSQAPITKSLIPQFIHDALNNRPDGFLKRIINETPDPVWKKIDYLWGGEMILSAAASLAVALLFPTSVWFYAKYIIGPVLSMAAFSIQGTMMHRATLPPPVQTQTAQPSPAPAPALDDTPGPPLTLIHSNIYPIQPKSESEVDESSVLTAVEPEAARLIDERSALTRAVK